MIAVQKLTNIPIQKIVCVRQNEPIRELDEYTETWIVVRILGLAEQSGWIYVLLERDEESSSVKLANHQEYLAIVDRIAL